MLHGKIRNCLCSRHKDQAVSEKHPASILHQDTIATKIKYEKTEIVSGDISNEILTSKNRNDLRHIAVATSNNINVFVSWNLKHIVRHTTKVMVNAVNKMNGFMEISICRPEELI